VSEVGYSCFVEADFEQVPIYVNYGGGLKWIGIHCLTWNRAGMNVPPGFILTIQTCTDFLVGQLRSRLINCCKSALSTLETQTGRVYGLTPDSPEGLFPLLVSVRYGASVDMPRFSRL
jgi:hypothetical protein